MYYSCALRDTPLVLPSTAMVSMSVFDLDGGIGGEYEEQLTMREYEYFKAPLRPVGCPCRLVL